MVPLPRAYEFDRRQGPDGQAAGGRYSYVPSILHLVSYQERETRLELQHEHIVAYVASFFQVHASEEGPVYAIYDYGHNGKTHLVTAMGSSEDLTVDNALQPGSGAPYPIHP